MLDPSARAPSTSERAAPAPVAAANERRADIVERLEFLAGAFAENVAAATRDYSMHVPDENGLAGMLAADLERARRSAAKAGFEGGFLLTLEAPSYEAAVASLDDRTLRKTLYEAYHTRASDRGPRAERFDNTPILSEMLELRHELARSSGYENYAALALEGGPIADPDAAECYVLSCHRETRARAQRELDELWAFAKEKGAPRGFSNWDVPYYAAWFLRERFGITDELFRPYFALEELTAAVLLLGTEILGVKSVPLAQRTAAAGARREYRLYERSGSPLGTLLLEPFGSGDASAEARVTLRHAPDAELPDVLVECGFEARLDGAPALLAPAEVATLFRLLGQAFFLVLSGARPGARVPSRCSELAAEIAGRFFAHFGEHFGTLHGFARHHETGERFSRELGDQLAVWRRFCAELAASQALELTLFDLRVHRDHVPARKATQLRVQVLDTFGQVRREQSVLPPSYWTRPANVAMSIFFHGRAARLWERDFTERKGTELFRAFEASGFSRESARRLEESFFAAGERSVVERLSGALGDASG
jgi:oligopeptidase A